MMDKRYDIINKALNNNEAFINISFENYMNIVISNIIQININTLYDKIINNNLSKKDYIKINNHYKKYKFIFEDYEYFLEYLKKDIKNIIGLEEQPSKQSIHEILQIKFYNKKYNTNIIKLHKEKYYFFIKNKDKIELVNNNKLLHCFNDRTKTFDCICNNILYIIKYTEISGGAQDNQVKDVDNSLYYCLKYIEQNKNPEYSFVAILGGVYMKKFIKNFNDKYNNKYITIIYLE